MLAKFGGKVYNIVGMTNRHPIMRDREVRPNSFGSCPKDRWFKSNSRNW